MNNKRIMACLALGLLILTGAWSAHAQKMGWDTTQQIEVTADRLEYDAERRLLIGTGNVLVQQGEQTLRADFVTVQTETEDAYAAGNVRFEGPGKTWEGEELHYNFKDEVGDFGEFTAYLAPLYVRAGDSSRPTPEFYEMQDVFISSCEGEKPEFYITAKEASVENDRYLRAKHAVFHLGGVPFFYFPYYKYDMARPSNWDFLPGYSSKWGAFLLSTYNMRVNGWMESATHLDARSSRGFAIGQDFRWQDPDMKGNVAAYYANDSDPHQDEDLSESEKELIDSDRYRLRGEHMQTLSDKDSLVVNFDYLSDPRFLDDFFTRDYEQEVQPENYAAWTHVEDRYTFGLLVNRRLNDFYENVNRFPEATLDFRRQEIQETGLFYEGNNSAVFLEKEFPKQSDLDSEKTFRLNTRHMVYYPTRQFGFLNLTPRAGYQGTYYNKTKSSETVSNNIAVIQTNTVNGRTFTETSFTNEVTTLSKESGSKWRNLPEIGFEASYQAFKTIEQAGVREGGLRHVAEPYTRYTFVPEPNVRPDELYQFDDLDSQDKQNVIRLGLRNKFQTKRGGQVANLLDLNLYSDYRFTPREEYGEEKVGSLQFDGEAYPLADLSVKFDGAFGAHGESFTHFNIRSEYDTREFGKFGAEYRYLKQENDQVTLYTDLFPEERWNAGAYWRYQVIGAVMEEQSYYVGHKSKCLGYRVGYTGRGDDWDIWFQLWLVAFPESRLQSAFGM